MSLIVALASLSLLLPQVLRADPFLARLDCVSIQASVLEVGGSFGVTIEVLRDALREGLNTHVRHLKIEPSCPDRIFYKVFLERFSAGPVDGFFGHVALTVTRKAIFRDTALLSTARAWDEESYLQGTKDKAKTSVLDQLNRHLTQFASDYRAANK